MLLQLMIAATRQKTTQTIITTESAQNMGATTSVVAPFYFLGQANVGQYLNEPEKVLLSPLYCTPLRLILTHALQVPGTYDWLV
jgi:hypothetical protein